MTEHTPTQTQNDRPIALRRIHRDIEATKKQLDIFARTNDINSMTVELHALKNLLLILGSVFDEYMYTVSPELRITICNILTQAKLSQTLDTLRHQAKQAISNIKCQKSVTIEPLIDETTDLLGTFNIVLAIAEKGIRSHAC